MRKFGKTGLIKQGLLHRWCTGKESACQFRRLRRHRFNPWVGRFPWSRKQQPTLVFLSGKFQWTEEPSRLSIVHEVAKESDTTEHIRIHAFLEMTGRTFGKADRFNKIRGYYHMSAAERHSQ